MYCCWNACQTAPWPWAGCYNDGKMKEPGPFPGCPVRGCKPVKWRDNGDQVCSGCLRYSSVSLRAPLSEREGKLPLLETDSAAVQFLTPYHAHTHVHFIVYVQNMYRNYISIYAIVAGVGHQQNGAAVFKLVLWYLFFPHKSHAL